MNPALIQKTFMGIPEDILDRDVDAQIAFFSTYPEKELRSLYKDSITSSEAEIVEANREFAKSQAEKLAKTERKRLQKEQEAELKPLRLQAYEALVRVCSKPIPEAVQKIMSTILQVHATEDEIHHVMTLQIHRCTAYQLEIFIAAMKGMNWFFYMVL